MSALMNVSPTITSVPYLQDALILFHYRPPAPVEPLTLSCSGHLPSPASQAPREGRTLTSKPRLVTLTIPNVFLCVFHVNSVNEPGTKFSLSVMCDCGWCSHSLSYSFSLAFSLALSLSLSRSPRAPSSPARLSELRSRALQAREGPPRLAVAVVMTAAERMPEEPGPVRGVPGSPLRCALCIRRARLSRSGCRRGARGGCSGVVWRGGWLSRRRGPPHRGG